MKRRSVVVAMSGGVDSAVSAALLLEAGYRVIGVTIRSWPAELCGLDGEKSCTSPEDARAVATRLKIPFYLLNFEALFREKVVDYFSAEYARGRTPNPCVPCNDAVKFGALLRRADEWACDYVATGHYARLAQDPTGDRILLKEARDPEKDQSYVLFSLSQEKLRRLLFPLGEMTKAHVRERARHYGLRVSEKAESQDACFLREKDYRDFLEEEGVKRKTGEIADAAGRVVGQHAGIHRFTIGQRSGLGVALGKPVYVTAIDPERNRITVGDRKDLARKSVWVDRLNWIAAPMAEGEKRRLSVKIRYRHPKAPATVARYGDACQLLFETETYAVTPGQAAVFYDGDTVVGGGWLQ